MIIGDSYEVIINGKNIYIGGDVNLHSDGSYDIDVDGNYIVNSDSDVTVNSATKLEFKVGDSGIVMEDGKVTISADTIELEGTESVGMNAKSLVMGPSEEMVSAYAALKTAAGPFNPDPISKATAKIALEIVELPHVSLSNVTKAVWILFAAVVGILVKLIGFG